MAKASKETLAELEMLLNTVASDLPKVSGKKMFGCHALWTKEQIFGLVWKEGRIGVRLPDETAYSSLMGAKGSAPWKAGPMTMAHWVLVPEGMHAKGKDLKKWVEKAHQLAQTAPAKAPKSKVTKTKAKAKAPGGKPAKAKKKPKNG